MLARSRPCSYSQEQLWFLHQLGQEGAAYTLPAAVRMQGRLDVRSLERALVEVVRRHESLRTHFETEGGQPRQVISAKPRLSLMLVDLDDIAERSRGALAWGLATAEARRPFDLGRGPLVRAGLLRLGVEDHVLLVTMHHAVGDGWSVGILIRELATLYQAFAAGLPSPLAEPECQFADHARWQREWLTGERLESELTHWREHLAGAPPHLALPLDRPRPKVRSFRGERRSLRLSAQLSEDLRALSRREGVTLFMTLLAAFKVLLSRLSGQSDIVVGTPIANRTRRKTEAIVGPFANTLALRTDVAPALTFTELLARVRETAVEAYVHQDLPFGRLIEELQPKREPGLNPIFQVMFALQNQPRARVQLPGLDLSVEDLNKGSARFDLVLEVWEWEREIRAEFEYAVDVLDASTVERWASHFETMLRAVVADPGARVSELALLREDERRQMLGDWNDTARPFPDCCVHDLFKAQAERTPEAVAVSDAIRSLTYAELNTEANRLARHLIARGIGPGQLVAICVDRTVEMVVALVGVLKAGAAYVPLDPAYPNARLGLMLEDARPALVLTEGSLLGGVEVPEATEILSLKTSREEIAAQSSANLPPRARPGDLAYVIYTSGSTGRPKGVAIPHRALTNFLISVRREPSFCESDTVVSVTTLSFDIAALELFTPLIVGARVVLASRETAADGVRLARLLEDCGATLMQATPATWRLLIDSGWRGRSSLVALCGGEALNAHLAAALVSRCRRLWHMFGPTETTVWSTLCEVIPGQAVTIGRPIANTEAYVLDRSLEPAPIGVVGELYLGGTGLARGYLHDPPKTAECFVPDPFSGRLGARLYRTGDLVRWRADGQLEFVGRRDHQVKVRGFRIELREIEAALREHPSVSEAVATVCERAAGDRRLVAHVVGNSANPGVLRAHLGERLPGHMIPAAIVVLDALPLTPSGKVDRRALPMPDWTAQAGAGRASPRTPAEELVAGIWAEVLGIDRVGVEDNFFDLGGHSLLATQMFSRLRERLGIEMPVQALFEAPTVARLTARAEGARGRPGLDALPPLTRADRSSALPLSFAQEHLWRLDQMEQGGAVYNMPAAVRLRGRLDVGSLERALVEVVRRHESPRTHFEIAEGRPRQVISAEPDVALTLVDLGDIEDRSRGTLAWSLAAAETRRPFDLGRGPLIRAGLLRLGAEDHVLLVTMHHAVSDGSSEGIFARELGALYGAFHGGCPSPFAEPQFQYADYTLWQRGWLTDERIEWLLAYWGAHLAGATPHLAVPADRPRPVAPPQRRRRHTVRLSPALSEELQALSRREGATVFMTVLAAFKVLLSQLSGQTDIVVGTPIAGRQHTGIENLIGFFANALVLRTDLGGNPTFREILARVRETTLGAHAHQDLPFGLLHENLHSEFDLMFAVQSEPIPRLRLPGLAISGDGEEEEADPRGFLVEIWETQGFLDQFSRQTIARWASQFETLLRAIVADPRVRLSELAPVRDGGFAPRLSTLESRLTG
jgi:amino acid adenylation domain-containing protein